MGTKRPHCRRDWDKDLRELGLRLGFEVLEWEGYPAKKHKVRIRCAHKEQWVFPNGQFGKKHCCKVASKLAENNPSYGKPTWNSGTTGISTGCGFGGKPRGEQRDLPGILYLVEYVDQSGTHLKVGITSKSIRERLRGKLKKVILSIELPLGECWDREQEFLSNFSEHRYSTESTTELVHMDQLQNAINYLNT